MKINYMYAITLIIMFSFSSYSQNQVKWYSFASGFGISKLSDSTITSSTGESFVGITSNENSKIMSGFFAYNSSIVTDVKNEDENIPTVFKLNQNYPNPFNPSTIISLQLPANCYVSLKVYDILGREVVTLVNEEKPAGNYKVTFDAKNLSSGVYFYRLHAGNYTSVKKMILLR